MKKTKKNTEFVLDLFIYLDDSVMDGYNPAQDLWLRHLCIGVNFARHFQWTGYWTCNPPSAAAAVLPLSGTQIQTWLNIQTESKHTICSPWDSFHLSQAELLVITHTYLHTHMRSLSEKWAISLRWQWQTDWAVKENHLEGELPIHQKHSLSLHSLFHLDY